MRRLIALVLLLLPNACLPGLLKAEDRWVKFASGPFELWTNGSTRAAREDLVRFEEFRNALGQLMGEQDLQTQQTVRILVFKDAKGWTTDRPIVEGRDEYYIVLDEKTAPGSAVFTQLAELFLNTNTARMPAAFEHGLIEFCSTLQVTGIRITAGAPPKGAAPDLDWARIHLLVTDPEYFGKLRVLLYNLRKGVDADAAYRNAFGKSPAEIEAQAKAHLAAGNFQTTELSSRPMSPNDFTQREVSDADARLARADMLSSSQSTAEYEALIRDHERVAEAEEGLGLLSLRAQQPAEAKRHFEAAMTAGTASARCYIEYAKLERDNDKAMQALLHAAGINPKLDEPFALMAARDTDPAKRLAHWKAAADRNPRNASYWQHLAEAYLANHDFVQAANAWDQAAQAATDPAERARMRQARAAIEQQRLEFADEQRRKEAEELEQLKQQARAEVHALEEKYREPGTSQEKPVPWWNGPYPSGKVTGLLKQVDCLGTRLRLVIDGQDHKAVKLLIADPQKVAISGGGTLTFGCGAQKPRRVTIEYFPKVDSRLATAGEVATIEFP
jgi:tetratricopeptide (TPR) repeat protein